MYLLYQLINEQILKFEQKKTIVQMHQINRTVLFWKSTYFQYGRKYPLFPVIKRY